MRIVHVITRWRRGGAEANVVCSIDHERRAGHDVILVVGRTSDPGLFPSGIPVLTVPTLVREISPLTDLRGLYDLYRLLRSLRPDVVHTHESKAGALGRLAAVDVPCRIHTVHMASFGRDSGRAKSIAYRAAERICGRRTHVMAAVGEELGEVLARHRIAPHTQHHLVRSPVRLGEFLPVRSWGPEVRAAVRRDLELPEVGTTIVVAGALEKRKRPLLAVESLVPLLQAQPDARLLFAGEGPQSDEVGRRAKMCGVADQVVLLGHRDDLPRVFAVSDVLLHLATAEGVAQVAVQALAAGLPVVTSQVEGMRELGRLGSVTVTDPTPHGIERALSHIAVEPPPPCPVEALDPWTDTALVRQRDLVLAEAARHVGGPVRNEVPARPTITVVVPTRAREHLVAEALRSIRSQSLAPDEVLVVHDGDDLGALPESTTGVLHLPSDGRGASAARNTGLAAACGQLVAFLDDDDLWEPTFLERSTDLLLRSGVDFVVGWTEVESSEARGPGSAMPEGLDATDALAVNPGLSGSNAVYRAAALRAVDGFDPALAVSNDKDLLVRLLASGAKYAVLPQRLVVRRVGGGPRLGTATTGRVEALERYRAKHAAVLTRRQDRYLRGRIARVERASRPLGWRRTLGTARMLALLGPRGVLQVRADDLRADPAARVHRRGVLAGRGSVRRPLPD